jgi:hypothetical protein
MHPSTPAHRSRRSRTLLAAALIAATAAASPAPASIAAAKVTAAPAAAPCIPAGHGPNAIPSIAFGRKGGNIRPMRISIYGDGTVAYVGGSPLSTTFSMLPEAVLGLQRLAQAEGFNAWPKVIKSTRLFPDVASLFITIRAGCSPATKTVTLQSGSESPAFTELFDTLLAATAQTT